MRNRKCSSLSWVFGSCTVVVPETKDMVLNEIKAQRTGILRDKTMFNKLTYFPNSQSLQYLKSDQSGTEGSLRYCSLVKDLVTTTSVAPNMAPPSQVTRLGLDGGL